MSSLQLFIYFIVPERVQKGRFRHESTDSIDAGQSQGLDGFKKLHLYIEKCKEAGKSLGL